MARFIEDGKCGFFLQPTFPLRARQMKLVLAGFSWKLPSKVTPENFISLLKRYHKKKITHGHRRILIIGEHEGYVVGSVLTPKTNKRFTTLELAKMKIRVNSFKKGVPGTDFNLFVFNPKPHHGELQGLYLHYHQTMKPKGFNKYIRYLFARSQSKLKAKAMTKAKDTKTIKEVKKAYPHFLETGIKVRPGAIQEWIRKLSKVRSYEYRVTSITSESSTFHDYGPEVKYEKRKIVFTSSDPRTTKEKLCDMLSKVLPFFGKIEGNDSKGEKVSFPLRQAPDIYKVLEYDEMVKAGFLDSDAIHACDLINQMVVLAKSNPVDFGVSS